MVKEVLLFISGGDLYQVLLNGSVVLVTSNVGDIPMYFEMMHGRVYCSNGLMELITESTVSSWVANVSSQMKDDKEFLGWFRRLLKSKPTVEIFRSNS